MTFDKIWFNIMSKEEEERLKNLEGRLKPNTNIDDDTLNKLGVYKDIYQLLEHLGWKLFSNGIQVHAYNGDRE